MAVQVSLGAEMNHRRTDDSESRFAAYVEGLASVIGHKDRERPLRDYCTGLLMPCERKSMEPIAEITAPHRTAAQHQSLMHFVSTSTWPDEPVLAKVREMVLPELQRHGPIEAWIIDDTGFPKQGQHSVGVARQYCGQLGKQDNCQVAVSLSLANHHASLPVAYQLYLPQDWADDRERRRKAGVPEEAVFRTKPQIALEQLCWAQQAGLPRGTALLDAGYGNNTALRDGITALGIAYAAGICSTTTVWAPGTAPLPAKTKRAGCGRPATRLRRSRKHRPLTVKALALRQPRSAWQTITWREGTSAPLASRFLRLRVRPAHRDEKLSEPRAQEWLLVEWPQGEKEPTKFWLSTLPEDIEFAALVDIAKLRWRIERDYQELKQEVGLGHFEGRGWRGFHHHATMCIAAYGFLVSERETIPPCGPCCAGRFEKLAIPAGDRPRGAADPHRASLSKFNRHHATPHHHRPRAAHVTMPVLPKTSARSRAPAKFVTQ